MSCFYRNRDLLGNLTGAFSDGAVLFPLVALLAQSAGYSYTMLFLSAGVAYILSGAFFKVPISIQPLKAIVIGGVALGATSLEIRLSGALVGLFFLCCVFLRWHRFLDLVPKHLVHGVQLGLGVIFIQKGWEYGLAHDMAFYSLLMAFTILLVHFFFRYPSMGLIAVGGVIWGVWNTVIGLPGYFPDNVPVVSYAMLRWDIVLALLLPQLALTTANSVVATVDVAERYFGKAANKVNVDSLMKSIGFGNLASFIIGGLPFCHGSGGITAHVRGGARDQRANYLIGTFLIALSVVQMIWGPLFFLYPPLLISSLLMVTGVFHGALARPSMAKKETWPILILMGFTAFATGNMLAVLGVGVFVEAASAAFRNVFGKAY